MDSRLVRQLIEIIESLLRVIETDEEVIRKLKQQLQIQEMNEEEED